MPRNVVQKAAKQPFWVDHFVLGGEITLKLPNGDFNFDVERGPEYVNRIGHFTINDFAEDAHEVDLKRVVDMAKEGWWSGDLDVQRAEKEIPLLMDADDLHLAEVLYKPAPKNARPAPGAAAPEGPWVPSADQRFYHRFGAAESLPGDRVLLCNLAVPFAGPPPSPGNLLLDVMLAAHEAGGWVDVPRAFAWDLPMWIAAGQVDSIELANSHLQRAGIQNDEAGGKPRDKQLFPVPTGNGRWNAAIYYHLLNCGLHIPPSAGSGSGNAPNPIGYDRAYVQIDGDFTPEKWWEGLRAGRVVVTNGPLLRPIVEGHFPGHTFQAPAGKELELEIGLILSTRETVHYLEVIKDGRVAYSVRLDEWAKQNGKIPKLKFTESGWFLMRTVTDTPATYRFASTAPYYVQIGYKPRISKTSAQFFLDWVNEARGKDQTRQGRGSGRGGKAPGDRAGLLGRNGRQGECGVRSVFLAGLIGGPSGG